MKLTVRDATFADLEGLCALRAARAQHAAKLSEAGLGTARFIVAAVEGELAGFASLFLRHPASGPPKSHLPKLSDCFVSSRHRSLGVGAALVSARERLALAAGCDRLYVSVDPVENPRWFDFFRRRGYAPLQPQPYRKLEPRHSDRGAREEVLAWRQDLVVDLASLTRPANETQ